MTIMAVNILKERMKRRPLLAPAILLIIIMNIINVLKAPAISAEDISSSGVIRRIESRLDGSFEAEIRSADYGRLVLYGEQPCCFRTGGQVEFRGDIRVPDPPSNPGEFDYLRYLKRRGIRGILYPDEIIVISDGGAVSDVIDYINDKALKARYHVLDIFDDEIKPLAASVFMGDSSLAGDDMTRAFRLSNCSHLLAVSGTHFSGFLMIISAVISKLRVRHGKAAPVFGFFCILVGTFTGWSGSVTRAAVMSICGFLSRDYLSGISLASLILIFSDPYSCLSPGFEMSFSAALGIYFFGGKLKGRMHDLGLPDKMADAIAPVLAATFGMMPFWERTCIYFSFFHLASSVFASFLATTACIFFIPSVVTGLPFACSFLLKILYALVRFTSSISLGTPSSEQLSGFFIASLYFLIVVLCLPSGILRKYLVIPAAALFLISSGVLAAGWFDRPEIRIVFIDVGQGDSCLIMHAGKSLLIDGGVEAEGRYSVGPVLDYYGITKVDMAVATHMDEDHAGGLRYLNEEGRIKELYTCFDLSDGDVISVSDSLKLYCLWPVEATDGGNEDSVVLRLEYEDIGILYTGDIGFETENELIRKGADLDADILKVGHHGSKYSTSTAFLEAVSPETAVISVVADSPYGHPAPDTLQRLEEYGCEIRRTDIEGAVIFEY